VGRISRPCARTASAPAGTLCPNHCRWAARQARVAAADCGSAGAGACSQVDAYSSHCTMVCAIAAGRDSAVAGACSQPAGAAWCHLGLMCSLRAPGCIASSGCCSCRLWLSGCRSAMFGVPASSMPHSFLQGSAVSSACVDSSRTSTECFPCRRTWHMWLRSSQGWMPLAWVGIATWVSSLHAPCGKPQRCVCVGAECVQACLVGGQP